jgi:dihydroorotate dehydrogenase (fumarate)
MTRPTFTLESGQPCLMNAAGTAKNPEQALDLLRTPASALMLGSYTVDERAGNEGVTYFSTPTAALNSLGLPSPPLKVWSSWIKDLAPRAADSGKPLYTSVAGFNPSEFRTMTEAAFEAGASAVELNLGCPNIWDEGSQKRIFSYATDQVEAALAEVRQLGELPGALGVKLSPIFDLVLLTAIDDVLASNGIDFLTTTNTVPNCFAYTEQRAAAISFGNGLAGMSGPAILWIGLGQVAMHRTNLPATFIFAVGGISGGRDVLEYQSRGADACQVATAFLDQGSRVFERLLDEVLEAAARETQGGE